MNIKDKKKKIFNIYAENFRFIKEHSSLKENFDKGFGCFCPICMKYFELNSLFDKENPLTLEHNPPKKLGGKSNLLTCKTCNSNAGNQLDKELLETLLNNDFNNFKPNSEIKTRLHNKHITPGSVNAKLMIDNEGKLIIDVNRKNNNPEILDNFLISGEHTFKSPLFHDFSETGHTHRLPITIKMAQNRNEQKVKTALLKIAYLSAFEKLGHIFLFSENINIIREQIKNPEKEIIKDPCWIDYRFPDDLLGVNVITKPRELRSILVVFDLVTKSDTYRYSICLPGFSDGDEKIYENISKILCRDKNDIENIEVNNYINSKYDIKNTGDTFLLVNFWDSVVEKIN